MQRSGAIAEIDQDSENQDLICQNDGWITPDSEV